MPRVNRVKNNRKTWRCGKCGITINPGDGYLYWEFRYAGKRRRCLADACAPRPSDLTNSKMGAIYDAQGDFDPGETAQSAAEALRSFIETVTEVKDEYQESADAMPENFHGTGTHEELTEKVDELDGWIDQLDTLADELEGMDEPEPAEDGEDPEEQDESPAERASDLVNECPC